MLLRTFQKTEGFKLKVTTNASFKDAFHTIKQDYQRSTIAVLSHQTVLKPFIIF